MKYFLVLCLLFCGFRGLAQKYYTGYYQKNDNVVELKTVPINSKKNEAVYGDLPRLIKFSPLSDSLICNFVYDKVSEANWKEIENNTSDELKSSAINGIVTCVNQVFGQKLLLPDGNAYTGPFFAVDENKLYLKGKCLEGLLIDTLSIVNYELNSKKFPISSRVSNMGGIKDFGEVDSFGSFFIVFKRVSVLEDYPIKCTNVLLQYYHKGEEYFIQAWSHFPHSSQTNQQSSGKIYFNSFKNNSINNSYQLIASGDNAYRWNANIFISSINYISYKLKSENTKYTINQSQYKGIYAFEWFTKLNKPESELDFDYQPEGINIFLDSNNNVLGLIYKPQRGNANLRFFPDSTYKGPELRFRREGEDGAVFYLMLKDFKPLQPKTIKINDIRELLATPKDFWGCKSCVEQE